MFTVMQLDISLRPFELSVLSCILVVTVTTVIMFRCCFRKKGSSAKAKGEKHKGSKKGDDLTVVLTAAPADDKVEENGTVADNASPSSEPTNKEDLGDFSVVLRETEILRSYRKPPPPKNRARQSRAPRAINGSQERLDIFIELDDENKQLISPTDKGEEGSDDEDNKEISLRVPAHKGSKGKLTDDNSSVDSEDKANRSSMLEDIETTLASLRKSNESIHADKGDSDTQKLIDVQADEEIHQETSDTVRPAATSHVSKSKEKLNEIIEVKENKEVCDDEKKEKELQNESASVEKTPEVEVISEKAPLIIESREIETIEVQVLEEEPVPEKEEAAGEPEETKNTENDESKGFFEKIGDAIKTGIDKIEDFVDKDADENKAIVSTGEKPAEIVSPDENAAKETTVVAKPTESLAVKTHISPHSSPKLSPKVSPKASPKVSPKPKLKRPTLPIATATTDSKESKPEKNADLVITETTADTSTNKAEATAVATTPTSPTSPTQPKSGSKIPKSFGMAKKQSGIPKFSSGRSVEGSSPLASPTEPPTRAETEKAMEKSASVKADLPSPASPSLEVKVSRIPMHKFTPDREAATGKERSAAETEVKDKRVNGDAKPDSNVVATTANGDEGKEPKKPSKLYRFGSGRSSSSSSSRDKGDGAGPESIAMPKDGGEDTESDRSSREKSEEKAGSRIPVRGGSKPRSSPPRELDENDAQTAE